MCGEPDALDLPPGGGVPDAAVDGGRVEGSAAGGDPDGERFAGDREAGDVESQVSGAEVDALGATTGDDPADQAEGVAGGRERAVLLYDVLRVGVAGRAGRVPVDGPVALQVAFGEPAVVVADQFAVVVAQVVVLLHLHHAALQGEALRGGWPVPTTAR